MSKKVIYFVSAIAMLVLAIAIGIIFSKSVPLPLTEEAHLAEEAKRINVAPLEPIENLIAHNVEGQPIATTSLADKYAQVQQELSLPPDLSAMDFSADVEDVNTSQENGDNTQGISTNTQNIQDVNSNQNPATEKNQKELDDILASASADISSQSTEQATKISNDVAETSDTAPHTADVSDKKTDVASNAEEDKMQTSLANANTSSTVEDNTQQAQATEESTSRESSNPSQEVNTKDNNKQDERMNIASSTNNISASNEATKIPKLKANALITSSSLDSLSNVNVITKATLSMDGDQVQLLLVGNNALKGASFLLDNPDRIVFDISGIWKMTVPRLISNRMVRDLRLGQTNSSTRLVFDMKVKPNKSEVLQISENEIVLVFK